MALKVHFSYRTFAPVWDVFKVSTEKLAVCHMELVRKLQDLIKEVQKYAEEQTKAHKKVLFLLQTNFVNQKPTFIPLCLRQQWYRLLTEGRLKLNARQSQNRSKICTGILRLHWALWARPGAYVVRLCSLSWFFKFIFCSLFASLNPYIQKMCRNEFLIEINFMWTWKQCHYFYKYLINIKQISVMYWFMKTLTSCEILACACRSNCT